MLTCSKMYHVAAVMLVMVVAIVAAQPSTNCATKLTSCSQFLNSINPTKECCDSLSDAITKDFTCLCNLYTSGVLQAMGINVTESIQLPKICGINGDLSGCTNSNGTTPPTIPSFVPPAPPLGENGSNGAGRELWRGILSVLLLICALLMAF